MIPWRFWLQYAVAALGLDPEAFFALTLTEWRWLTECAGEAPLSRDALQSLVALYPDQLP